MLVDSISYKGTGTKHRTRRARDMLTNINCRDKIDLDKFTIPVLSFIGWDERNQRHNEFYNIVLPDLNNEDCCQI